MPPKRKRAGDSETAQSTARVTRSSTHTRSIEPVERPGDTAEEGQIPKKTKRSSAKSTTAKGRGRGKAQTARNEIRTEDPNSLPRETRTASSSTSKAKSVKPSGSDLYSAADAAALFSTYADADDDSVIGPEGFERLCSDMDISLEGALPLILAWQMNASEMAKISRSEWDAGTTELKISDLRTLSMALHDLEDIILLDKPPLQRQLITPLQAIKKTVSVAPGPYNRAKYYRYAGDPKKAFNELYLFCFALAKSPEARNIDIETASAFWSVLLVPRYPIVSDLLDFINEKGTYRGVNKDLWNMTLEFCRVVHQDLSNYEADGAWPTMLDDFVAWKGSKSASGDVSKDNADA